MKKLLFALIFYILSFIFYLPKADAIACSFPTSGNTSISTCQISTVDGVDAGTGTTNTGALTISSGQTLTLNANSKLGYGSVSKPGAIIAKTIGTVMQKGPIWAPDADSDGYPTSANPTLQLSTTQPASTIRRNAMNTLATADCLDSNATVYQNVASLVTDADNDGYKTSAAAATQCVGASSTINTRTYYKNASNASTWLPSASALGAGATDCDDTSGRPCPPTGVSASAASTTQMNVSWSAGTGPAQTSYNLVWCSGASCTPVTTITGVTSIYAHTGRTCGTTYGYNIIAVNASGSSNASSNGYGTTSACVTAPNVPNSPAATVDNPNRKITVSWSAPTGGDAPTGYYVYWCSGSGCTPATQIDVGNVTSYQHTSLTCGTIYRYQISAYNTGGEGTKTAVVSGTMNSTTTTCYVDADGDGVSINTTSGTACGTTCPAGKLATLSSPVDCYDANASVFPDHNVWTVCGCNSGYPYYNCIDCNVLTQASFHTTTRPDNGTYDWNCNTTNDKQYSCVTTYGSATACLVGNSGTGGNGGWVGSAPACGSSGTDRHVRQWCGSGACTTAAAAPAWCSGYGSLLCDPPNTVNAIYTDTTSTQACN